MLFLMRLPSLPRIRLPPSYLLSFLHKVILLFLFFLLLCYLLLSYLLTLHLPPLLLHLRFPHLKLPLWSLTLCPTLHPILPLFPLSLSLPLLCLTHFSLSPTCHHLTSLPLPLHPRLLLLPLFLLIPPLSPYHLLLRHLLFLCQFLLCLPLKLLPFLPPTL